MGARDLLHELAEAGFRVTAEGDRLVIRPGSKLTDTLRAALREAKPDLVVLLRDPAQRPLAPAWWGWDDEAIARFEARRDRLVRWGWPDQQAEDLAERLHMRDAHADHRALCLECRHLSGTLASGWRCGNHKAANVSRELAGELVTMFQDCPGFQPTR